MQHPLFPASLIISFYISFFIIKLHQYIFEVNLFLCLYFNIEHTQKKNDYGSDKGKKKKWEYFFLFSLNNDKKILFIKQNWNKFTWMIRKIRTEISLNYHFVNGKLLKMQGKRKEVMKEFSSTYFSTMEFEVITWNIKMLSLIFLYKLINAINDLKKWYWNCMENARWQSCFVSMELENKSA